MNEIDDTMKKAVKAAIKQARAHLKNCEMIMKGWVPENRWPTRARWNLSDELHKASESLWKGQDAVLERRIAEAEQDHDPTQP